MDWIELTIHTTTAGADIVSEALMAEGATGTMVEDRADIPDPDKPNGYWEIIDPNLISSMPEDVLVHAWFTPDSSFADRMQALRSRCDELHHMDLGLDLGTLEISTLNVRDEDWAEVWKKFYKPFKAGRSLVVKPTWEHYDPQPGNRIIEDDIIRETGTSRTSIRPALLRLKYEGLVEMIPNRGAFVAKPSEEDLRQVYRVREVLEHGMLEDAIRHRTEAQLRAMEENLKAQEVLTQHYSRQEYVTLNHTFHWLVEASANKYYEKYLNELYNKINTYVIFYDQSSDNNSLVSHTMIYEALRDRDLEKGLLGLREDIQIAWEDMRKINVPL